MIEPKSVSHSRPVVPLGLAVCLSLLGDLSLYTVLVTQLDVTGLSLAAAGVMLGVNRLVRLPFNPVAGLLYDRHGRRPLFLLGMLLAVVTTASYGLAYGFWPFLLARMLWGVAWTLINVGGRTIVFDISAPGERGRLAGFYNTAVWAGFAAGPLAGGSLTALIGFRSAMLTCAAFTGLGLLIALVALPETGQGNITPLRRTGFHIRLSPLLNGRPVWRPARRDRAEPPGSALHNEWSAWKPALRRAVSALSGDRSRLLLAALFVVSQFAGEGVARATFTLLLQSRLGATIALGGLALPVAAASGGLLAFRAILAGASGPAAGRLSDARLGRWRALACTLGLGALALLLLAFAPAIGSILIATALAAASASGTLAILLALAGDQAPAGRQGFAMGLYATAGDAGLMLGPFVSFALLPLIGLSTIYLFCALLLALGIYPALHRAAPATPRHQANRLP